MRLTEGACDLLIVLHHASQPLQLSPERYEMLSLGHETLAAYACADAAGRPMFRLPVPSGGVVPLLAYAEGAYMARMVELILRQAGGEAGGLEAVHEADMAEGLKAMAVEGHGLAFLPASAVRNELHTGRLVPAAGPGQFEVTMDIRLYRERPDMARHTKPLAQDLWSFLQGSGESS